MSAMTVACSRCGTENDSGRKFCSECGTSLARLCPTCGTPNAPSDKFCGECGSALTDASTGTGQGDAIVAAQRTAERRLVSILFVDLVGFTGFSESRDAEEVRGLLTRYFDSARQIVELYGGMVEKFIGDAVMAVWGTPIAREDDAERAVRAAMDLVGETAAIGREMGIDLRARAGVFTGEAAVTLGATGQGMVAGDAVNTASRLQSVAEAGSVLVDETTHLAARDAISFETDGDVTLKGREGPVSTWRPVRVIGGRRGFQLADSLEPPFTGRDEELRLIKDLLHATGREMKPRLASVLGVAGIGKSRLVWELYKYVDGLEATIYWHQGRSPAYGDGVTYWSLAEMVRMRAGIAETDDPDEAARKLDATLQEWLVDEEERSWVGPRLEQLLGLRTASEEQQEQLFSAWRTFFERIAERGTVLLVFEDVHWADAGLMDFIEHVMAWARSSPIFVVTLARPELMDRRPNWGAGQRNFVSVHLEPLSNEDVGLLLKGVVNDLPAAILGEVVERSEGIPLYAVEMVRMLIDRKQLAPQDGGYTWAGTVDHIDVPETLHSLIASRLDSLPVEDRLLVQDASVLGKTFTLPSLVAVAGIEGADLEGRLRNLSQREIFTVDSDPRSPERGQYGFVQSLIKEVAYQTLSKADRAERHVRAAEHFESIGDADMLDVIANHYVEAFRTSPNESLAAPIAAKARRKLVEAGERAASLGSFEQAASSYESALEITSDAHERTELLMRAGDAAGNSGQHDRAITRLGEAVGLAEETQDSNLLAQCRARLGSVLLLADRIIEGHDLLEAAVREISDPLKDPNAARLFAELGRIEIFRGNFEVGAGLCAKAIPPAEANEMLDVLLEALISKSVAALGLGHIHEAEVLLVGALDVADRKGLPGQYVRATINLAAAHGDTDPHAALEAATRGLQRARRLGFRSAEPYLVGNAAEACHHLGRWEWAKGQLETMLEFLQFDEQPMSASQVAIFYAYAGEVDRARNVMSSSGVDFDSATLQIAQGNLEAALTIALMEGDHDVLDRQAERIRRLEEQWAPGQVGVTLARVAYLAGRVELAERARTIAKRYIIPCPWTDARLRTIDAALAALAGRRDEAVALYAEALGYWDDLDLPFDRVLCLFDFALLVGSPEADGAREEARAYLEEMGHEPLLRQLTSR